MKLSRLYSNRPEKFEPIEFRPGLNVVMGQIRLPENRKKDTHNLGKTTLGRLLDFCFLAARESGFFLFKHPDLFNEFAFFLEVELQDGSYLTLRRAVEESSKVSFKKHQNRNADFVGLPQEDWDHFEVPFDRARDLADSLFDVRALKPWAFRKGLGYHLRSQDDYRDIFQLRRFVGAHSDWKPYLAHLLGFNGDVVLKHYAKEDELTQKQEIAATIRAELGGSIEDLSKIEGMLLLKQDAADKRQKLLDAFDFRSEDKDKTKDLVEDLEESIGELNSRRYSLMQSRRKIALALQEEQTLFDPDEAARLFRDAGVLFQGQIKKDFEQLIAFNKAITEERKGYLTEERRQIDLELREINNDLSEYGRRRSQLLAFLSTTDSFDKYKKASDELVVLKAEIAGLERQRGFVQRLQDLRAELRVLDDEKKKLQAQIEEDVERQNRNTAGRFNTIRLYFNEIVEEVIDRKALISVAPNQKGHLEFAAEILDEGGKPTSADDGHTYRKLLCIAFDMAVLRAYLGERFPLFAFHDGVFESLDDRKKENLLGVLRRYSVLGIQQIITLIDSDLPTREDPAEAVFNTEEVILLLHDEGEQGRLFKMKTW